MIEKLRILLKKHGDFVIYLIFGVITTLVNYIVYFPLYNAFSFSAVFSNVIAWVVAVIVAFLTNKPFVFKSCDWSSDVVIPEFVKFLGSRLASGVAETMLLFITVDAFRFNGNLMKFILSIFVVILNYIASKFFVFKEKK